MGRDRRQYPRSTIGFDVTVEAAGQLWKGKTVDLSPYGVKVALSVKSVKLPLGTRVQVEFPAQDQDSSLSITGSVVRTDPDGIALRFDGLGAEQFRCFKDLVGTFLLREWQGILHGIVARQGLSAHTGISHEHLMPPKELSLTSHGDGSKKDRWQALLNRLGLDLQLPSNGALSRPWREFLEELEANALASGNNEKSVASRGGSLFGLRGGGPEGEKETQGSKEHRHRGDAGVSAP